MITATEILHRATRPAYDINFDYILLLDSKTTEFSGGTGISTDTVYIMTPNRLLKVTSELIDHRIEVTGYKQY